MSFPAGSVFASAPDAAPSSFSAFTPNDSLPDVTVDGTTYFKVAWWKFTPEADGTINVFAYYSDLTGLTDYSAFQLQVFTGASLAGLTPLQPPASARLEMTFDVVADTAYWVAATCSEPLSYRLGVSSLGRLSEWRQPPDVTNAWSNLTEAPEGNLLAPVMDPGFSMNFAITQSFIQFNGHLGIANQFAPTPPLTRSELDPHFVQGVVDGVPVAGGEQAATGFAWEVATAYHWPGESFTWPPDGRFPGQPLVPIVSGGDTADSWVGVRIQTTHFFGAGGLAVDVWGTSSIVKLHDFAEVVGPDARAGVAAADAAGDPEGPNVEYEKPFGTVVGLGVQPYELNDGFVFDAPGAGQPKWAVWGPQWRDPFTYNNPPIAGDDHRSMPVKWGPNKTVLQWTQIGTDGSGNPVSELRPAQGVADPTGKSYGGALGRDPGDAGGRWLGWPISPSAVIEGAAVPVSSGVYLDPEGWNAVPITEVTAAWQYEEDFMANNPGEFLEGGFCAIAMDERALTQILPGGWDSFGVQGESHERVAVSAYQYLAYRPTIRPARYRLRYPPVIPPLPGPEPTSITPAIDADLRDTGQRYE